MIYAFLLWVVLSFSIILSFDILSFSLARKGWRRFISTFVLFYAQVISTEFILGMLSLLTRLNLVLLNVLIATVIFLLVRQKYGSNVYSRYIRDFIRIGKGWIRGIKEDGWFLALLILALGIGAWVMFLGLLFPVIDVDGNAYHMTFIINAIQTHSIASLPTSIPWLAGYPKGGELIQMWNVIVPYNEALADLAQLPFLVLGVVSLYELALRVGVNKRDAKFGSLLLVFLPIVINQAKTTYVDIIFCSLFLAALAMSVRKKPSNLDLVLIGIIFSLLISVKSTGLLLVAATLPFLLLNIVTFKKRKLVLSYKKYGTRLLLVGLPMIFGFYWYVKNFVTYKTPLYPFGLQALGFQIFPGQSFNEFIAHAFSNFSVMPEGSLQRLWFVWTEQKDWFGCLYNYDSTFSGLGPIWFVLLLPSILVGIIIAVKKRNYLFLALSTVLLVVFMAYPANYYTRYIIFIVAVGILAFGLVCSYLGDGARTVARLVAVLLVINVIATTFTLCNFTPKVIRDQLNSDRAHNPRGSVAYQNSIGTAYLFIQNRVQPGEKVAYDSSPYYVYPLWRSDYSNKVLYIQAKDSTEWYSKVKTQGVRYIFTSNSSKEHKWIQRDNAYKSIYKDVMYEVYEVY